MAAGSVSVDTMLADAISKMDALNKRMDALETGTGHKNPVKGDDDDDDKKSDAKKADAKKADDDDDDKKDDATAPKHKILDDDDDDDDKKDDAAAAKGDDGELEIKHKGKDDSKKADAKKADAKKADAKKADAKKADAKKADDDDDKKDDDDDDKKDDDDDDDDDKKSDAARADDLADLRQTVASQAEIIRKLSAIVKPRSDDEHAAFAESQAKADSVFNGFGQRAPRPLEGESLSEYRRRLASKLKSHSERWKNVKLRRLDDETFGPIEDQIYADAIHAATNPVDLAAGEMRMVQKIDPATNQRYNVFYGKESFVKSMGRPGRRVASFRTLASQ